jgi:hypothetical protein
MALSRACHALRASWRLLIVPSLLVRAAGERLADATKERYTSASGSAAVHSALCYSNR